MTSHDNFLLITPEGWTEVENAGDVFGNAGYDIAAIGGFIADNDYTILSQVLEDAGIIEPNTQITAGRVINTGVYQSTLRFWYIQ